MVYLEYTPVEENQNKNYEFYPMETTIILFKKFLYVNSHEKIYES